MELKPTKEILWENGKITGFKFMCKREPDFLNVDESWNEYFVDLKNIVYGEYKNYRNDGTIKAVINFKKGNLYGSWAEYNKDGTISFMDFYKNNENFGQQKIGIIRGIKITAPFTTPFSIT
jgi:antitoxin component YwqK of YwqJK toxin-antitoxin module